MVGISLTYDPKGKTFYFRYHNVSETEIEKSETDSVFRDEFKSAFDLSLRRDHYVLETKIGNSEKLRPSVASK